jgi:predicted RNA-binding protein with RPS1 domain
MVFTVRNVDVARVQDKGVVVDLGDDIEGFVPLSQLGVAGLQNPADLFAEGDELEMEVTEVDPENRRIVLNTTRVPKLEEGAVIRPRERAQPEAEAEGETETSAATELAAGLQALDGDGLDVVAADLLFPCVLKPLSLAGSRGVIRADDPAHSRVQHNSDHFRFLVIEW